MDNESAHLGGVEGERQIGHVIKPSSWAESEAWLSEAVARADVCDMMA